MSDVGKVSNFSPEQRRDIVLQLLAGRPMAELAREHQLSTTAIYRWRDQFLEAGILGFQGSRPNSREQQLEREVSKLKELVGDLSVANYALKKGGVLSRGNAGGRGR